MKPINTFLRIWHTKTKIFYFLKCIYLNILLYFEPTGQELFLSCFSVSVYKPASKHVFEHNIQSENSKCAPIQTQHPSALSTAHL